MLGVLYLHGFCSSSRSQKGVFLSRRFRNLGVDVVLPDLDQGDFLNTTLSGQMAFVDELARETKPALLVGSSLGGYLAALYAARNPHVVPAIALMAPAFDFANRLRASLGPAMRQWQTEGQRAFFHYREQREALLGYGFYRDAVGYEPFPDVTIPTRVLHGRGDAVVAPALTAAFARDRPNVSVQWLDTDHQMLDVTDEIWSSLSRYYTLSRTTGSGAGIKA